MTPEPRRRRELVREALRRLDVRTLSLSIHDACFPGHDDEDLGRGSPYSRAGQDFVRFAHAEGFDALQLGPQGETPPGDPSPYRGSMLPKEPLSIAIGELVADPAWGGLVPAEVLQECVKARPPGALARVAYEFARDAQRRLLDGAFAAFTRAQNARDARLREAREEIAAALRLFEHEEHWWLERYELYDVLRAEAGGVLPTPTGLDARLFAESPAEEGAARARRETLRLRGRRTIERFRFVQFVAARQHASLRTLARELGLRLFADLQIGMSEADAWCHASLLLDGYRMGAPPSRTNPAGQPWGYPVFDPDRYDAPHGGVGAGPVRRFLAARVERLMREFDGVRIDHPHGLVDPWVYAAQAADAFEAVAAGARLFSSPDVEGHPALARFAIARPEQLRRDVPRHADDWVRALEPAQITRYARLVDEIVAVVRRAAGEEAEVPCEVLSTLPRPVGLVLERAGLGRFRVTQKAALHDPRDVYRSENARPEDWIMVGNHDTPPLRCVLRACAARGETAERARYLASRLAPRGERPERLAAWLAESPARLAHAFFADLFASPARHVMVFFSDLLGLDELYNDPGSFGAGNWRLRVPPDYLARHAAAAAQGLALDLPAALALALRAGDASRDDAALASALEREAARFRPSGRVAAADRLDHV